MSLPFTCCVSKSIQLCQFHPRDCCISTRSGSLVQVLISRFITFGHVMLACEVVSIHLGLRDSM